MAGPNDVTGTISYTDAFSSVFAKAAASVRSLTDGISGSFEGLSGSVDALKGQLGDVGEGFETLGPDAAAAASAAGSVSTAAGDLSTAAGTASAATEDLGNQTSVLGGIFSDTGDEFTKWVGGFASGVFVFEAVKEAFSALTEFVSGSIDAYSQAQQAEQKLTVALQTQGLAIPGLKDQYLALGETYEQTTAFSHTAIEGAEALFVQLGDVGPDQMDKALQAATDLSAGLGIALPQAVELLSRAAEGQTASFSRYGIVLDQTKVQAEGFGYVLDAVEAKVGGQAAAQLDTYAGQVAQLGNEWDSLKEKIGELIVQDPIFKAGLLAVKDAITDLSGAASSALPNLQSLISFANNGNQSTTLVSGLAAYVLGLNADNEKMEAAFEQAQKQIDQFNAKLAEDAAAEAQGKSPVMKLTQAFIDANAKGLDAWNAAVKAFRAGVDNMESALDNSGITDKVKYLNAAVTEMGGVWELSDTEFAKAADQAEKLAQSGGHLTSQLAILASMASDRVTTGLANLNAILPNTSANFDNLTKGATAFADAIVGEANQALAQQVADLDAAVTTLGGDTNLGGKQFLVAADAAEKLRASGADLTGQLQILAGMDYTTGLGGLDTFLKDNVVSTKDWIPPLEKSTDDLKLLKGALDTLASAIGGDIGTAIKSFGELSSSIDSAGKDFSAAFGKNGAFAQGDTLGGIEATVAGISSITGAAITAGKAVIALWNDVFGDAGRQAVESFAASQGGFDALHQQLDELGAAGEQLWVQLTQGTGNNNAAQAQANIQKVTDALNNLHTAQNSQISSLISGIQSFGGSIDPALDPYIQKLQEAGILTQQNATDLQNLEGNGTPSYATLTALQQKYNLTAAEMGPSFQTQQIDANFQTIIDDMDTLTRGGADVTAAMFTVGSDGSKSLSGLGTAIQGDIQAAINAGVQIPENLQPAAQALIAQGDLVDANGKAITNVSQLSFGQTMQTDLETLNTTLQQLIATMTGNSPNSLTSALKSVGSMTVSPTVKVNVDTSALNNLNLGGLGGAGLPLHGTGGYFDTPQAAIIGDSPEWITPTSAVSTLAQAIANAMPKSFGGSGTGGGTAIVQIDSRTLAEVLVPQIPGVVKRYGLARV